MKKEKSVNKRFFYFLLACGFIYVQNVIADNQPSLVIPPGSPVYVTNNYFQNKQSQSQESDLKSDLTQQGLTQNQASNSNSLAVNTPQTWNYIYEQVHKNYSDNKDILLQLLDEYKITLSCSVILAAYTYILYQIHCSHIIIHDSRAWSNWNHGKTLEQLFAISQHQLETELLFAFQHRYIHPTNPTDFMYSLVQSSISLQQEIDLVQQQIQWYQWIIACRCSRVFFIDDAALVVLQDKQRKLAFMKHIFSSWCANYKIEKNS